MTSAKKVRSGRQHDTLPRAKFLSANQQQKSKMKRKRIIKKHQGNYNKKPETNNKSIKRRKSGKGRSKTVSNKVSLFLLSPGD